MDLLADRPTDRPTDWLTDWLTDRPTDSLTDRLTDWLTDWPTDRPTDSLTDSLTHWLTDRSTNWFIWLYQLSWKCKLATVMSIKLTFRALALRRSERLIDLLIDITRQCSLMTCTHLHWLVGDILDSKTFQFALTYREENINKISLVNRRLSERTQFPPHTRIEPKNSTPSSTRFCVVFNQSNDQSKTFSARLLHTFGMFRIQPHFFSDGQQLFTHDKTQFFRFLSKHSCRLIFFLVWSSLSFAPHLAEVNIN